MRRRGGGGGPESVASRSGRAAFRTLAFTHISTSTRAPCRGRYLEAASGLTARTWLSLRWVCRVLAERKGKVRSRGK